VAMTLYGLGVDRNSTQLGDLLVQLPLNLRDDLMHLGKRSGLVKLAGERKVVLLSFLQNRHILAR